MKRNILTTTSSFSAEGFDDSLRVINNPHGRRLSEEEVIALVLQYRPVGIIAGVEPMTRAVMKASPDLLVISRCGTGLDSVDLDAAAELGIKVMNTPDVPVEAVAELTIGMMIACIRHIPQNDADVRNGLWKGTTGLNIRDRTVGLIGCGRIGSRVSSLLQPFGCRIIGYDPGMNKHTIIEMTDIESLIKQSDIISLHVPLNDSTRHIISKERIESMKTGVVLINISRGGLVDEDALCSALEKGSMYAAAIDTFEEEPYSGKLKSLKNVILSPHIGSSTVETRMAMEKAAVENLIAALDKSGVL